MDPNPIAVTFSELYTVASFFINLLLLKLALLSRRPTATSTATPITTTAGRRSPRVQSFEDTCPSAGWAGAAGGGREECAVCLSEFASGEAVRELGCGHTFHKDCVDEWLFAAGKVSCPLCRSKVIAVVSEEAEEAAVDDDDDDWGSQQFALLLMKLRGRHVA